MGEVHIRHLLKDAISFGWFHKDFIFADVSSNRGPIHFTYASIVSDVT